MNDNGADSRISVRCDGGHEACSPTMIEKRLESWVERCSIEKFPQMPTAAAAETGRFDRLNEMNDMDGSFHGEENPLCSTVMTFLILCPII